MTASAAINAHLMRTEFFTYTFYMTEKCGIEKMTKCQHRFRPLSSIPNTDITVYGDEVFSTEDILINSALAELYCSEMQCNYCPETLNISDISDVIHHLETSHAAIFGANFSCAACLKPQIFDQDSFLEHFKVEHSPMLTLLPVINEIQTGARLQMALAVYVRLVSLKAAGVTTPTSPPVNTYISKIGAYGSISKLDLYIKYETKQLQALPPKFVSAVSQAASEYRRKQEKIREEQSKQRQSAREKIQRQKQFHQQQRQYQHQQQQQRNWTAHHSIIPNNMPPEFDPQYVPACRDGIPDFIRQYLAKPPSPDRPASPVAGPSQCKRQRPTTYNDIPGSSTAVLQTPRDILDDGSPFSDANYQPDEALLDEDYEY
jgi:hypothetical protein